MAQETLKITITADNKQAVQNIQETVTATTQLGAAFNRLPANSAQATNALSNLSRVAQDAPYGFMGIANNLNPLLESFQRLQKEAGGSGAALKAMAGSLMGPAGIGLALGVASSLLVTFGDKLFVVSKEQKEAEAAAKEHTEQLKEQKNAIDQIYASTAKEVTEVSSLIAVLQNENETRNRKLKALEALKKINPEIFGALQLEKGAVIGLNEAYDKYITNLSSMIALKIKQKELEQLTEEILKKQGVTLTQEAKDIAQTGKILQDSANTRKTDIELRQQGLKETIKQRKEEDALNGLLERRKKIFEQITELSKNVEVPNEYNRPTTTTKKAKDLLSPNEITDILRARYKTDTLLTPKEVAPEDNYFKDLEQQHNDFSKFQTKWLKSTQQRVSKSYEKQQKDLEDLMKEYERFANTIANTVTGALFSMYDAMQQGESAGEALSQMFSRLLRQLAEMAVKAAVFAGILSLLPGGSVASGGLGFLGYFNKILGIPKLADGGLATGPTLAMIGEGGESEAVLPLSKLGGMLNRTFTAGAMSGGGLGQNGQFVLKGNDLVLALQRSTSSLNLRRG